MTVSMIATHRLRGALVAVAAASVALISSAVAGVNQTACLSMSSQAQAQQTDPARQIGRAGPGLLGVVRQIASSELALSSSTSTPHPIDTDSKADQGQLSDHALRERIARYRISPTAAQRHASLRTEPQAVCSD